MKSMVPGISMLHPAACPAPARTQLATAAGGRSPHRVLFVDHTALMSGGEIALLHLVRHLDRSRFQPIVVLFADGPLRAELEQVGVETHIMALHASIADARKDHLAKGGAARIMDVRRAAAFVLRLAAFIRTHHIDLVHTNSLKADIIGGAAARLARTPVIWHIRDRIDEDYLPPKVARLFRLLCRLLPNQVIANSDATLRTLFRHSLSRRTPASEQTPDPECVARPPRMRVVHDGIPLDAESQAAELPDLQAAASGFAEPRIGLVGRITRWKGQHVFIRAAALVRERFPHARFLIIGAALFGEAAYEKEIHDLAASIGLGESVEFTGFRRDVKELIGQLTVLVHASITGEPFGQVVVEGMAAAKPVVATRGGGIPEIVVDGQTGLLVPINDAHAMADAVCRLLDDPRAARQMGLRGRRRVGECFTIQRTVANVQSVYQDVLGLTSRS